MLHTFLSKFKNKKGFSLIEIVIYMGLLAVLLLVLADTFTSIIQVRLESEATSSVEQDANYIMAKLMYDVGRSTAIVTPSTLGSTSTSLVVTISGTNYTYGVSNGNLTLTVGSNTDQLNSINTTISNFQVVRLGGVSPTPPTNSDSLKINFRVTSVVKRSSGNEVKDYEITVAPR